MDTRGSVQQVKLILFRINLNPCLRYGNSRMILQKVFQAEAAAEAEKIEARYSDADLLRLIRAHGLEESSSAAPEVSAQAGEA